jgi:5-methylcytosine-specific restriction protein A
VAATVCDHIVPLAEGGTDATSNLQPLCQSCHNAKTMRETTSRARYAIKG